MNNLFNHQKRLLIFIVAYNAQLTIESVLARIPVELIRDYLVEVLIIDDSSQDETFHEGIKASQKLNLPFPVHVLKNPINQGYGGNQKIGYHYAIEFGFDYVALIHGDGQYAPEALPDLMKGFDDPGVGAVFGSRMLTRGAARAGGMPLYKFVGNKILSGFENYLLNTNFSEFHSGYRIYSVAALKQIPFDLNTNDFHFDTEIIIQFVARGLNIYCLFLLSLGSFELKKEFALSLLFQNMWEHLSNGSLAIDEDLIGLEGFETNKITTAYFLPFPSLIRFFLSLFNYGESAILSVLLGCLTFFAASLLLWRLIFTSTFKQTGALTYRTWVLGILLCTLLSPILGMLSFPTPFWEAIIWASALYLLACVLSVYVLQHDSQNSYALIVFSLVCGLSLFTRATFSFSTCLLFCLTLIQLILTQIHLGRRPLLTLSNNVLIIGLILFSAFLSLLLLFNYLKWGNPFEFYPLQHYKMWSEEQKLHYFSHGALNLFRLPETISYYFLPVADNFSSTAPFIQMASSAQFDNSGMFDYREPRLAILLTEPIPVLLFLIGLITLPWAVMNRMRKIYLALIPAAVTSLIPIIFILSIHSLSIRYAGDFLPAIMIFSLVGLIQICIGIKCTSTKPINLPLTMIISALIVFSLYLSTSGVLLQDALWKKAFDKWLIPMQIGEVVEFKNYGNNDKGVGYLQSGWAKDLESFGTWSNSTKSKLLIAPPINLSPTNTLIIQAKAFVSANHPEQIVDIWVNGKLNQTIHFTNPDVQKIIIQSPFSKSWSNQILYTSARLFNFLSRSYNIPTQETTRIDFFLHNPVRPKDLGIGNDDRLLGIGLISMTLQ
jgi:glycosyltransferase involved in cell wall biosynthesis